MHQCPSLSSCTAVLSSWLVQFWRSLLPLCQLTDDMDQCWGNCSQQKHAFEQTQFDIVIVYRIECMCTTDAQWHKAERDWLFLSLGFAETLREPAGGPRLCAKPIWVQLPSEPDQRCWQIISLAGWIFFPGQKSQVLKWFCFLFNPLQWIGVFNLQCNWW